MLSGFALPRVILLVVVSLIVVVLDEMAQAMGLVMVSLAEVLLDMAGGLLMVVSLAEVLLNMAGELLMVVTLAEVLLDMAGELLMVVSLARFQLPYVVFSIMSRVRYGFGTYPRLFHKLLERNASGYGLRG